MSNFTKNLRNLPGEAEAGEAYYASATALIDDVIDGRLRDGIKRGAVPHMSEPWYCCAEPTSEQLAQV